MSGAQKHPYHLVEPSPWPASGALGALTMAIGGVLFMHEHAYGVHLLVFGLLVGFADHGAVVARCCA